MQWRLCNIDAALFSPTLMIGQVFVWIPRISLRVTPGCQRGRVSEAR